MRDTIRGIVGKLRKGIDGYLLVVVDTSDYSIHTYLCDFSGELRDYIYKDKDAIVIGWYRKPIKMSALRDQIERKIGGIKL
jgi:hypothetical protein